MKPIWVLALMFTSIVIATILHVSKSNSNYVEDDISRLETGMQGIQLSLPEHTNISFKQIGVDNYLYCRYLLAPRYCSTNQKDKLDTTLTICKTDASDSILHSITDNKKVIWKNMDKQYRYFLTSNH